jgi:hypothetical protein
MSEHGSRERQRPLYLERAIEPYQKDPQKYSALWRRVPTDVGWHTILDLFHPAPCALIDIASGDGKDADFFCQKGYKVSAVEPSSALRYLAQKSARCADKIMWLDDALPQLTSVPRGRFKMVTASTAFVHIMEEDHKASLQSLFDIAEPGGRVALSLRDGPQDPDRLMFATNTEHFIDWARTIGFTVLRAVRRYPDRHNREDVFWNYLMLEKND